MSELLNLPTKEEPEEEVAQEEVAQEEVPEKEEIGGPTVTSGLSNRIQTVSERPPFLKVLFYGDPGSGKTVLAARAPKPLIVDTENGTLSLLNHDDTRNTPRLPLETFGDLEDLLWEIKEGNPKYDQYDTIVLDSITELQKRQMDEHLRDAYSKDRSRDPYIPVGKDYQRNTEVLRRLVIHFRDLEKNLIIIAHAKEERDDGDGRMYLRPAVTPKLGETLMGIFDIVGYLSVETGKKDDEPTKRFLQVHPDRRVNAKTRIGGLPKILEDPTFDMLIRANEEEK